MIVGKITSEQQNALYDSWRYIYQNPFTDEVEEARPSMADIQERMKTTVPSTDFYQTAIKQAIVQADRFMRSLVNVRPLYEDTSMYLDLLVSRYNHIVDRHSKLKAKKGNRLPG